MKFEDNPFYLRNQIITYLGNKRTLLPLIGRGISLVQEKLGRRQLDCLDMFSGSGIVSRALKQCSRSLSVNDLELYARVISSCYLADSDALDLMHLHTVYDNLIHSIQEIMKNAEKGQQVFNPGFIEQLYAPRDADHVTKGERCFYTPYNARYIDIARSVISDTIVPEEQCYFIAPLLSEASVHANTAGIFKGFYKNSVTGCGQFGGNGRNALNRIRGEMELPFPVFSNFSCPCRIFQSDANLLAADDALYRGLPNGMFDVVYLDPPYNQHPYGSNYFMLNLIASYIHPDERELSFVSGIPHYWNRSQYNRKTYAAETFSELAEKLHTRFLLVSFNSEGFISREDMVSMLGRFGKVTVLEFSYNTFRGSRNLRNRSIHVSEYLFVVEKHI
jgi:adenine-specific DNA-methyltransferase